MGCCVKFYNSSRGSEVAFLLMQAKINILANKLRSFLAILGIMIGSGSIVALLCCSQLATQSVITKISELGSNIVSVSLLGSADKRITTDLIAAWSHGYKEIEKYAPIAFSYDTILYDGAKLQAGLVGTSSDFTNIAKLKLQSGRFISNLDQDEYCMIGAGVSSQTGSESIVGQQLKYGDRFCTVVGVLAPAKSNFFIPLDINNTVLMAINVLQKYSKDSQVRDIIFSLTTSEHIDSAQSFLAAAIHKDLPKSRAYFRNPNELIAQIKYQKRHLAILLSVIGSISLLVGGIGIMNIMLVSVVERKREIGIRLAVGAHVNDIKKMFLTEAVLLSLIGGLLGVLSGLLFSLIMAHFSNWPKIIFLMPPVLGFFVAVLTGVFFGFYPAAKASRLNPVDALRD